MTTSPNYTPPTTILKLVCPVLNEDGTSVTGDLTTQHEFISADEARSEIVALMEAGVAVYNINGGFRVQPEDADFFTDYIDARCIEAEWRHQ